MDVGVCHMLLTFGALTIKFFFSIQSIGWQIALFSLGMNVELTLRFHSKPF